MAITDTPWCGNTNDKLYLQSGQFTSTLKTSEYIGGTEDDPTGISYDGINTPWCGNLNDKLYLQSGQFTSTIKTSEYIGGIDATLIDISYDGIDTPWCGNLNDKLYLQSGQFTSTLKTSEDIGGIDDTPIGISYDGTDTPWAGLAAMKLYLQSGQFTSTLKTSEDVSGIDDTPTGISYDGADTPWPGLAAMKLYLQSGQFTSTLKTSEYVGGIDDFPRGIETNDINARIDGNVDISPSVSSIATTILTPVVVDNVDISPSVLPIVVSLLTPVISINIQISTSVLPITVSVPVPMVLTDIQIQPSVLPISILIPAPVIIISVDITPSVLPITTLILTPVIPINVQISTSVLSITTNILTPIIIISVDISPSVLPITTNIPASAITIINFDTELHSLWSDGRICLFVDKNKLKRLFPDYSVSTLRSSVGRYSMSYTYAPNSPDKTEDTIYYANTNVIGYINAQGVSNTFPDPEIAFRTAPEPAQHIEYYHTRLYFGDNQTIWYSDALGLGRINKRLNNIPLSDEITMMEAVDDGIWVSTGDKYGRIFFLAGNTPQEFTEITKADYGIIQGSAVKIRDAGSIFHGMGLTGTAIVFATKHGICLCGNGGRFINLTYDKYKLTDNRFGAGLMRIIDNKTHYIATTWS